MLQMGRRAKDCEHVYLLVSTSKVYAASYIVLNTKNFKYSPLAIYRQHTNNLSKGYNTLKNFEQDSYKEI